MVGGDELQDELMKPKKVLLVAGEVSGDLLGSHLVEAVQEIDSEIQFFGIGGEGLKKRGMKILFPSQSLAVVGLTEVFLKLGKVFRALRVLKDSLEEERPELVILIDFPDFNLRLAKIAYRKGIPVLYYVSPQVWAWRQGRVKLLSRCVKKMVVLFPFEVSFYEREGVDVEWVGHPLIDIVKPTLSKEEAYQRFGLDPQRRTIGLLPGSRQKEVERLLPPLLEASRLLYQEIPELQFIIPLAPGISLKGLIKRPTPSFPLRVVEGWTYDVMNLSELLVTASGTATLEGAILGKPMVIIYKLSRLSYWVGRLLIQVDHIGLVNLVAEKGIVPELIQEEANPKRIAEEAFRILKDPIYRQKMVELINGVRNRLGDSGASRRAARIVYSMLHEGEA